MNTFIKIFGIPFIALISISFFYPIDGYERTGIKRLKRLELIQSGELKTTTPLPPGALRSWEDIHLNLKARNADSVSVFFAEDEQLQKDINALFRGMDRSYSLSVLDISDPEKLRYAHRNETLGYQPGSVGKIAVLVALFDQLSKVYPDSFEDRLALLRNKSVDRKSVV